MPSRIVNSSGIPENTHGPADQVLVRNRPYAESAVQGIVSIIAEHEIMAGGYGKGPGIVAKRPVGEVYDLI